MTADTGTGDRTGWARGLEPAAVWREFALLSAIPRKSKQEAAARRHVVDRLADLGITAHVDGAGNVVAEVPASQTGRSREPVVLQAHLDMVCEADATAGTDPTTDGVFPVVVDGWVHAPGTTLGADDGIGVAIALAIAAEAVQAADGERQPPWPPLQLLLTVDEEEDFTGAAGVDPRLVTGKRLLNLDAEAEDEIVIGSAGGSRVLLRVPAGWQAAPAGGTAVELRVHGLQGGHSGHQIGDNVMNALKALCYTLASVAAQPGTDAAAELLVADLRGGRADNAIPREARAVLIVGVTGRAALERAAGEVERRVRAWRAGDGGAVVEVVEHAGERPPRVLSPAALMNVVDLIVALPSGVLSVDEAQPDVVRTSTNLGIAYPEGDDLVLVAAPRSSRPGDLDALHARYASFARLAGGRVTVSSEYPAWEPDHDSPLLEVARSAYRDVHGRAPRVTAVHAGLEAAEIASHLPGLVAVSIGPTIERPHSPGERLEVASVARFHDVVRAILTRLANG